MISDDSYEPPFSSEADSNDGSELAEEGSNRNQTGELSEYAANDRGTPDPQNDRIAAQHDDAEQSSDTEGPLGDDTGDPFAEDTGDPFAEDTEDPLKEHDPRMVELAEPFVGRWNGLISKTNWEKGGIINEWRARLVDAGASVTEFSDEAWARRVGGVTAPHVGRLRRVHDRFADTYESYDGLYWSHFLAALDWDDAPLWLEGASREGWSVSQMREQRWQAEGAVDSQRPTASQIVEVDTDEDVVVPAQGGGRATQTGEQPDGVSAGPAYEPPDFGDQDELTAAGQERPGNPSGDATQANDEQWQPPIQPFAGLPELPEDLADAIEQMKLAVLRHKTNNWNEVDADTIQRYLNAMAVLIRT